MKNNIWETGTFFGVPASFFYPALQSDSSRICGSLCGFIGGFGRFHLDELEVAVKMNCSACLDESDAVILTETNLHIDEKIIFLCQFFCKGEL